MNNDYSLIHVLKTLAKWKKHIYIITGIVALLSVIGSLLMPNYYKSTALLYAASPTLANPDPIGGNEKLYYVYGTGEDLDRLFSIANSGTVKSHVIDKFNLAAYYDVDTTSAKGKAKLAAKFNKLYETKKTKFDALEISIEDVDPQIAKDLVEAARLKVEAMAQAIIKESQQLTIESLKEGIQNQEKTLKITGDSLTILKERFGIYDSYSQAEAFALMTTKNDGDIVDKKAQLGIMKQFKVKRDSINKVKAQIAGLEAKMLKMDTVISLFNEGVLSVRLMEVAQNKGVEEVSLEKERLKKLESTFNKSFTAVHIVEKETVPVEKSRPKRSIIVIGLTLLAFVLSSLAVLLIDSTKNINWREIYAGK